MAALRRAVAAPGGNAAAVPAAARRPSLLWLQGLACGALIALTPSLALLAASLLAPAGVAALLDRQQGRPAARAVLLCGLSTCIGPVRELWSSGEGMAETMRLLLGGHTVAMAWGAAAGGWVLSELAPLLTRLALDATARSRLTRLRARRERLLEQWTPAG